LATNAFAAQDPRVGGAIASRRETIRAKTTFDVTSASEPPSPNDDDDADDAVTEPEEAPNDPRVMGFFGRLIFGAIAARERVAKSTNALRIVAYVIAALVLFPSLAASGIWDPYELDNADLARRVAINVLHVPGLTMPNAANGPVTLTDLRAGELGFTSMATGFKLFGLHDWSGRLPLALWGFVGIAALYELIARLVDKRAGLYAALALATMPLYFMQARTMLGDAVTMSAFALAFSGGLGALLDRGATARGIWSGVAVLGLIAGFLSRGLLIGVAIPSLAIGVTWLALRGAGRTRDLVFDVAGLAMLIVGVAATLRGGWLLHKAWPDAPLLRALGVSLLKKPTTETTFDLTVRQLGHGLFPWSALLPFAIGRALRAPKEALSGDQDRDSATRIALLIAAGVAYACFAFLGPYTGPLPFSAPAALAGLAGIAILDVERSGMPSRAAAFGVVLLAAVLYHDLSVEPDKALACFVVERAQFPRSFEAEATKALRFATLAFSALIALAWFERQPRKLDTSARALFLRYVDGYRDGSTALGQVWAGNLAFGFVVIEAALVGLGAMIFLGRRLHWAPVEGLPRNFSDVGLNAWWSLPLVVAIVPGSLIVLRDTYRYAIAGLRLPRSAGIVAGAAIAGGILSFWYYPALAAQLSPKEVFASYAEQSKPGQALALLGVRNRAASYYSGGEVESFTDPLRAFDWLTANANDRRFMIVKADDLPKLNSLHRKQFAHNLPVLDGRSSQILLVSNQLNGHANESWIASMVLDAPPAPRNLVDAGFEDQLEVFGWEVREKSGELVESVVPQRTYHLRFYYRVLKPISGTWKAFVHVDGFQRRFNGDHSPLEGKYPMNLWQPGDIIVDDLDMALEPNFTPGDYTLYFGFYQGDSRFRVTRGPVTDNRVIGGQLHVR
jgi:hypothetical protein